MQIKKRKEEVKALKPGEHQWDAMRIKMAADIGHDDKMLGMLKLPLSLVHAQPRFKLEHPLIFGEDSAMRQASHYSPVCKPPLTWNCGWLEYLQPTNHHTWMLGDERARLCVLSKGIRAYSFALNALRLMLFQERRMDKYLVHIVAKLSLSDSPWL